MIKVLTLNYSLFHSPNNFIFRSCHRHSTFCQILQIIALINLLEANKIARFYRFQATSSGTAESMQYDLTFAKDDERPFRLRQEAYSFLNCSRVSEGLWWVWTSGGHAGKYLCVKSYIGRLVGAKMK